MKRRVIVGSAIPVEGVDPHTGSFLSYGVIAGWADQNGKPCKRKNAVVAIVESSGNRFGPWDDWCEDHAWKLDPFLEG